MRGTLRSDREVGRIRTGGVIGLCGRIIAVCDLANSLLLTHRMHASIPNPEKEMIPLVVAV